MVVAELEPVEIVQRVEIEPVRTAQHGQIPMDLELVGTLTVKNSSTFGNALRLDLVLDGEDVRRSSLRFFNEEIRHGKDFQRRVDEVLFGRGYYLLNGRYTPRGPFGAYPEQIQGDLYREIPCIPFNMPLAYVSYGF